MKVILVDDHMLVREGLRKVLRKAGGFEIIGEASSAEELFSKSRIMKAADILILDISLPGRSGLEILTDLRARFPDLKTLILSMHPESRFATRALRSGAWGYISKDNAARELVKALRSIGRGKRHISTEIAEQLVEESDRRKSLPPHALLSEREFQILRSLANGKRMVEIASAMSLSIFTVSTYRARILKKMKMKSNAEIIRYAIENRLVE